MILKNALSLLAVAWVATLVGCDSASQGTATADATEASNAVAQKATVGVGKKGQSLEDNEGVGKIFSGPVSALLRVEQKAVFDIKIPHALNLYKALEGKAPQSHEEFMTKIVEANRIKLPELPEGAVYRFNTEKEELWVYPEDEAPK